MLEKHIGWVTLDNGERIELIYIVSYSAFYLKTLDPDKKERHFEVPPEAVALLLKEDP